LATSSSPNHGVRVFPATGLSTTADLWLAPFA